MVIVIALSLTVVPIIFGVGCSGEEVRSSLGDPAERRQGSFSESSSFPTWIHESGIQWTKAVISDDGGTILVAEDEVLRLFTPSSNQSLWWFNATEQVFSLSTCDNGSISVIGTALGHGILYLLGHDNNQSMWQYDTADWVVDAAISGDGSTVAAVDWSGLVYLFDSSSNSTLWRFQSPDRMLSVAISSDGETVLAGGRSNTLYVFCRSSNITLWTYELGSQVNGVSISDDGSRIVASGAKLICAFNRDNNETLWKYSGNDFVTATISGDGSTAAVGSSSTIHPLNLYVFDFESNETLWTLNTTNQVTEIDISYDGAHLIAGSYDNNMYVFSRHDNSTLLTYNMSGYVWGVGISDDGLRFVSSGEGLAVFFEVQSPSVTSVTTPKGIYGPMEMVEMQAGVTAGTFAVEGAFLYYSGNGVSWTSIQMENLTNLSDSIVEFSVEIGPFPGGVIQYYVWSNDSFALISVSPVSQVIIDGTPPDVHSLVQNPQHPNSTTSVSVAANVTDSISAVDKVILNYTSDGSSWVSVVLAPQAGHIFSGSIPSRPNGTTVLYHLIVNDTLGNAALVDDSGSDFQYKVEDTAVTTTTTTTTTSTSPTTTGIAEPPNLLALITVSAGATAVFALVVVLIVKRRVATRSAERIPSEAVTDSGGEE